MTEGDDYHPVVAHVITRLDAGGSATNTLVSVDRLREHGFQTKLFFGITRDEDGEIQDFLLSHSIDSVCIPSLARNINPVQDVRALIALVRVFRTERFDLIHTHTSKAGLLGRIAARLCDIPCVHTPHGHVFYGYFSRIMTSFFVLLERMAAKLSDRIVSLTNEETRESLKRRIGKPEQYVTIPRITSLCEVAFRIFKVCHEKSQKYTKKEIIANAFNPICHFPWRRRFSAVCPAGTAGSR